MIAPSLNDVSTKLRYDSMVEYTVKVPNGTYKKIMESQADGIKNMLLKAKTLAAGNLSELIDAAKQKANVDLGAEDSAPYRVESGEQQHP